ncbi:hypothetical protein TanjilG_03330 [Lupinus angustifolius]|uniref:Uncharacterized protein n=1 Tax=Lupinus angustifolius TaxID=3871 RepID=A0A4P1RDX6_LUPAN|nr:hypothetical protein TanjilG_03330 [Lupinus angustifolius]
MAHNISKSTTMILLMVLVVGLMFAAEVIAQDVTAPAPAPAPEKDTGAGSLVTYSGVFVCFSLFLSFLSLLRH